MIKTAVREGRERKDRERESFGSDERRWIGVMDGGD